MFYGGPVRDFIKGKILVFGQEILTLSLFKCKFDSMLMRINV